MVKAAINVRTFDMSHKEAIAQGGNGNIQLESYHTEIIDISKKENTRIWEIVNHPFFALNNDLCIESWINDDDDDENYGEEHLELYLWLNYSDPVDCQLLIWLKGALAW